MKFFRSKLFISILLLFLAGILTFVFLPTVYGSQSETVDVVQFIDDVKLGTQITEKMLTTKTIGKYGVASNVIKTKDEVVGKYAANDIRRDTNLFSDQFTENFAEVDGAMDTLLKKGDKLVTVTLASGAVSVGGMAKPGDYVDVLTQKHEELQLDEFGYEMGTDKVEMELQTLMRNVRLYKLQNSELQDISELERKWRSLVEENTGAEEEFDDSLIPAYATLIVSDEQALALANQEYDGTVHLVLHPVIDGVSSPDIIETPAEPAAPAEGTATPAA